MRTSATSPAAGLVPRWTAVRFRVTRSLWNASLLLILGVAVWNGYRLNQTQARYETELQRTATFAEVKSATGRPLPSVILSGSEGVTVQIDTVAFRARAAIWIFASTECLYCLAEIEAWKDLAARNPSLRVIAIATGVRGDLVRAFVQSEGPPFPVLYDSIGAVRERLGLPRAGTVRLLAGEGLVILADHGKATSGLSFVEQVKLLLR